VSVVAAPAPAHAAAVPFVPVPLTWYAWLANGFFCYFMNLQGNIIPLLQEQFDLSYRVVSLHSSAVALGVIAVGLTGDRIVAGMGRRLALRVGTLGVVAGAALLCISPGPAFSIASCILIGASLNPVVVPALLADIHGPRRADAYAGQSIAASVLGIAGPLLTGLFLWLGFGWRYPVVLGMAFGIGLLVWFRRATPPEGATAHRSSRQRLPAAFWAYWLLLSSGCALEFSVLLWAPAYLERVAGFSPATAAALAAGYFVGVIAGRVTLGAIVSRVSGRLLLLAALGTAFAGFLIYWGIAGPVGSVVGVLLLGLGVAPLYPLTMSFAVGVAGPAANKAAARLNLAFGVAILIAPIALGAIADEVGLAMAHLTLPFLIGLALTAFLLAQVLQKRAAVTASA
jgi:MFS family permease